MAEIPEKYRDLLDKKIFVSLGTILPDGSPQVTPVWFDYDGRYIRVNSEKGRVKTANMLRDPRVSLSFLDPENNYRYMEVRGRVVETTEAGASEHIDALAKKYMGVDKYPYHQAGHVRIIFKIEADKVSGMG